MEKTLNDLVERLKKAHGERLVSAILYGSAAIGDHHGEFSDVNVFCVLKQVTPRELGESEPVFKWWREQGNPSPLLMSEDEVRTSSDCFPIEFHDMQARHRVLHGADILADIEIDRSFYRAQVEHELRSKQLRLRQKAAGVLSDGPALLRLLIDSVSTFCVLGRHALLLAGHEAKWHKREVVAELGAKLGLDTVPFETLLDLRQQTKKPRDVEPGPLFENYLKAIQTIVQFVDRLDK